MLLFWGVYWRVLFCLVSPLLGCTGSSILHCEFGILFAVCHVSHCLCTLSMASTTSAPCMVQALQTQKAPHAEHAHLFNIWHRDGKQKGWWPLEHLTVSFPLGFLITDTAMNICSAHHTCSGQAGDPGNAVQPSAGVAFKPAVGPVKMGLTVQGAMW